MSRRGKPPKRTVQSGAEEVFEEEEEVVVEADDDDEEWEPRRKRRRRHPRETVAEAITEAVASVNVMVVGLAAAQAMGQGYLSTFQSAANAAHNATALSFSAQTLLQASTVAAVTRMFESGAGVGGSGGGGMDVSAAMRSMFDDCKCRN